MDKVVLYLQDWVKRFLEHRNLFQKNLKDIKAEGDQLNVTYKDREVVFFIMPNLDIDRFQKEADKDAHLAVVCLNIKENLEILIRSWKSLVDYKSLSLYFANPFSDSDTKWVVRPAVHDRITEKASLETGLRSLFEGVQETTLDHVKQKI